MANVLYFINTIVTDIIAMLNFNILSIFIRLIKLLKSFTTIANIKTI